MIMKKKIKEKQGKDVIIPFGFDKMYEPMYACDNSRSQLRGVMLIISPKDEMITPADTKMLKCITNNFVVTNSPSNKENFSTDKNAYFEKVSRFLLQ